MANRVLLTTSGLKVSKAGSNVLSPGAYDLLFDSSVGEAGLEFSTGSTTVNVPNSTSTNTYYSSWVYFNGDQSALNYTPVIFANRVTSGTFHQLPERRVAVDRYLDGSNIRSVTWDYSVTFMEFLDKTRFRFAIRNYFTGAGFYGLTAGTYTFQYIVLSLGGSTITSA